MGRLDGMVHPPTVEIVDATASRPILLLCDHAGRYVPERLNRLGISAEMLCRHIGWDIGAANVTRRLSCALGASAILNHVSRLVIDVNRRPFTSTSIPSVSDGCVIPGNEGIDRPEIIRRIRDHFIPYHRLVARCIGSYRRNGVVPLIVAVHSFTSRLNGEDRPWEIGVVWRRDPRLSFPLMAALRDYGGFELGDNKPYSGSLDIGYTLSFHAVRGGVPHAAIEVRQDLLCDETGEQRISSVLEKGILSFFNSAQVLAKDPRYAEPWFQLKRKSYL